MGRTTRIGNRRGTHVLYLRECVDVGGEKKKDFPGRALEGGTIRL